MDPTGSAATVSDAQREGGDFDDGAALSLSFLRGLYLLLSGDDPLGDPALSGVESHVVPYGGEALLSLEEDPVAYALPYSDDVSNVISYHVTVSGVDYVLYLSPDYVDSLYIDSQKRLWNVGTANISGRLFQGDFDAMATTGRILTLGPCLGNNFSSNRNYGSPNYVRRYYWSGNSLTYDTTYVSVTVRDSRYPFRVSDTLPYVGIFLLGGCLICLWKRSSR